MRRKHRPREKDPRLIKIKETLKTMPEFNEENTQAYQRLKVDIAILNEIFFDRNFEPNFTNTEMRKLDLSEIDFLHKSVIGRNYSYTNINIDPQQVLDKSLIGTNLEGVDLSNKDFTGVWIVGANLNNTSSTIDISKIKNQDIDGTKLEGCQILNYDIKKPQTSAHTR